MSPTVRLTTLGLAAATVFFGWDAWHHLRAARALREATEEIARQGASLAAETRNLAWRDRLLVTRCSALEQKEANLKVAGTQAAGFRPLIATGAKEELSAMEPKRQMQWLKGYHDTIARFDRGLIHRLGLTPAQAVQFADIMTERQGRRFDLETAAYALALDHSAAAYRQIQMEDDDHFRADMTALVGEDGFRELEQFEAGRPVSRFVTQLLGSSFNLPDPITPDQATRLQQIIQSGRASRPALADHSLIPPLVDVDWPAVEAKTAVLLTPSQQEQLAANITYEKYRDLQSRLTEMMRRWITEVRQQDRGK